MMLFDRAERWGDRIAIVADDGTFTYAELLAAARSAATKLRDGRPSLDGARVAMMISPSFASVAVLWGTWLAGGIAVPLALTSPKREIEYVIDDAAPEIIVSGVEFRDRLRPIAERRGTPVMRAEELVASMYAGVADPPALGEDAMLLYTSGTTGGPKGVVWRHSAIAAQAEIMSTAWGWQPDDRALLVLPLHHVHGLISVVITALWNGATVELQPAFDAAATWERLRSGEVTVFMAVPTIYRRLLAVWHGFGAHERSSITAALAGMRLMVSGSAALPVATLEEWHAISGHVLLERYGMTEIGMALSNPYEGERMPGAVGRPLPSVEARVVDDAGAAVAEGTPGGLLIRGPSVFARYWRRPDETRASFVDGWFRTGDVVEVRQGIYRILGRESVDIIKTGGEKVSALEIEDVLRSHPQITDCAVVGVADPDWGERVVVAVTAPGNAPSLDELRAFCRDKLAPAKIPRSMRVVSELPRNALGKVLKPHVKDLFG